MADAGNLSSATDVVQAGLDPVQRCVAARAILYAAAQVGKRYLWGSEGPDSFDCSGLTMRAYLSAGMIIPRVTYDQWAYGVRVPDGREQPGDLVFFRPTPRGPGHVGLVIGSGKMIEARCTRCGPIAIRSYGSRTNRVGFTRPAAR
jgi:cell wall-associated NlpC family hydrolase